MAKRKEAQNLELARRPGVSVDDAGADVVPETPTFTMRHLDDMAETVESSIQPLVTALFSGRSELLRLFKPTGPLPEDEQVRLMNLIRVLMDTNAQLKAHAKKADWQLQELTAMVKADLAAQRRNAEGIERFMRKYKPLIGPHNEQ